MTYTPRLNYKADGHIVTDESVAVTGANKVLKLKHHNVMTQLGVVVWSNINQTGTQITDFTISSDSEKSWITVVTFGASVSDGTYYVTYYSQGDKNDADDLNDVYDESMKKGERLIARYVHSGNPEFHISSVDWATGIVTFTQPHGLASKTIVSLALNKTSHVNPLADFRSIPIEWQKMTSELALLPIADQPSQAKVVRTADEVALTVNTTSTENNGNLDTTKFHFENINTAFEVTFPECRKIRMRTFGWYKYASAYRYMFIGLNYEDGTNNAFGGTTTSYYDPYINFFNVSVQTTGTASRTGIYLIQDIIIDAMNGEMIFIENNAIACTRRGATANTVDRHINNIDRRSMTAPDGKKIKGIYGIKNYSSNYAYLCNGGVVEIYDMGGVY